MDKQLKAGIEVEKEHTWDLGPYTDLPKEEIAKLIAQGHLTQDDEYYSKLQDAGLIDEPEAERILDESLTWSGHKLSYRTKFKNLNISIENRKGSIRRGVDKDGNKWENKLTLPYGYVRGVKRTGPDGDFVDVFIGPDKKSDRVFIVHQKDLSTGEWDEDKCMLGFSTEEEAREGYLSNYDSKGPELIMDIEMLTFGEFEKELSKKSTKMITLKKNEPEELNEETQPLLAPNGKPSNLKPYLYRIVRSEAFKRWFGPWDINPQEASKCVDENGEPLVVYHGTGASFTEFGVPGIDVDSETIHGTPAIYFSPTAELAKEFTRSGFADGSGGHQIKPCFLNIRKCRRIDFGFKDWWEVQEAYEDEINEAFRNRYNGGVAKIAEGKHIVPQWFIFDPKNAKAIYNKGNFNPEDAHLSEMAPVNPASAKTQRSNTTSSYTRAGEFLAQLNLDKILDFGAGKGEGSKALQLTNPNSDVHSFEPNAIGWPPHYTNSQDIPKEHFNGVVCLNVLNVVPKIVRDEIVQEIWDVLSPGGIAIIGTRGWSGDVGATKQGTPADEEKAVIIGTNGYQKGFDGRELENYLKEILPQAQIEYKGSTFAKNSCLLKKPSSIGSLKEAKGYGSLYHSTSYSNLASILKSGGLRPSSSTGHNPNFFKRYRIPTNSVYFISLSRNPHIADTEYQRGKNSKVIMEFDGEKLSSRYKLYPFIFSDRPEKYNATYYRQYKTEYPGTGQIHGENEEILIPPPKMNIVPMLFALKRVIIIPPPSKVFQDNLTGEHVELLLNFTFMYDSVYQDFLPDSFDINKNPSSQVVSMKDFLQGIRQGISKYAPRVEVVIAKSSSQQRKRDLMLKRGIPVKESFKLSQVQDRDSFYNLFQSSYTKATGHSWDRHTFDIKSKYWTFYGDESGAIAVSKKGKPMSCYKITAMFGNMKGVSSGLKEFFASRSRIPTYTMVDARIAKFLVNNFEMIQIPEEVIQLLGKDILGTLGYDHMGNPEKPEITIDIGDKKAVKYLLGNRAFYKALFNVLPEDVANSAIINSYKSYF